MTATSGQVERRLWAAADELRANSRLKASEYSMPVLGLIFLRYADVRFSRVEQELAARRAVMNLAAHGLGGDVRETSWPQELEERARGEVTELEKLLQGKLDALDTPM